MVKDSVPQVCLIILVELGVADRREVLELLPGPAIQQVKGGPPDGVLLGAARPNARQVLVSLHIEISYVGSEERRFGLVNHLFT